MPRGLSGRGAARCLAGRGPISCGVATCPGPGLLQHTAQARAAAPHAHPAQPPARMLSSGAKVFRSACVPTFLCRPAQAAIPALHAAFDFFLQRRCRGAETQSMISKHTGGVQGQLEWGKLDSAGKQGRKGHTGAHVATREHLTRRAEGGCADRCTRGCNMCSRVGAPGGGGMPAR